MYEFKENLGNLWKLIHVKSSDVDIHIVRLCVCVCVCVCVPHLFVNLQELLHGHLLVLGNPQGSVDAPEAASSAVLIEEQVLVLYLHKRRARGRHGILTHTHMHPHIHTHTDTESPEAQALSRCCSKSI